MTSLQIPANSSTIQFLRVTRSRAFGLIGKIMKKHSLRAQKRNLVGRKVKTLRSHGLIPATVYGNKVKSMSVSVPTEAFTTVFQAAGETGLVELSVDGDIRPVLIHTVQKNPVKRNILHVEFYQVDLKKKVKTNVPVEITGEAPATTTKTGVLLNLVDEIEVEALPTDLPDKILIDVSALAEVGQEIKVQDISAPSGVTILTDPNQGIVRVAPLVSKEAAAAAVAAAAAAAAKAEEQVAAAAVAAETPVEAKAKAAPAETAKEEEKKS